VSWLTTVNDLLEKATGRRLLPPPPPTVESNYGILLWDFRKSLPHLAPGELEFLDFVLPRLRTTRSQFLQDLWVLFETEGQSNGFFVDFGATDGIAINNSLLLECSYGWTGILAEPNPACHSSLRANRKAVVDSRAVWSRSGYELELLIPEVADYATLRDYQHWDYHGADRQNAVAAKVETVSLQDLLNQHDAPDVIDFLSIDTEGSELDILSAYDFGRTIRMICVEHNFAPARAAINGLLVARGYVRRFERLSGVDDWYILGTELVR
jgi:FkbM family methyltransferase